MFFVNIKCVSLHHYERHLAVKKSLKIGMSKHLMLRKSATIVNIGKNSFISAI